MYFMYVDESGDNGLLATSSKRYVLSAMVIKDVHWQELLVKLKTFRKQLKQSFGFKIYEEIHAGVLMSQKDKVAGRKLSKYQRYSILFEYMKMISGLKNIKLINVYINKIDKMKITMYLKMHGGSYYKDLRIRYYEIISPKETMILVW